jgi:hypothetical protein
MLHLFLYVQESLLGIKRSAFYAVFIILVFVGQSNSWFRVRLNKNKARTFITVTIHMLAKHRERAMRQFIAVRSVKRLIDNNSTPVFSAGCDADDIVVPALKVSISAEDNMHDLPLYDYSSGILR